MLIINYRIEWRHNNLVLVSGKEGQKHWTFGIIFDYFSRTACTALMECPSCHVSCLGELWVSEQTYGEARNQPVRVDADTANALAAAAGQLGTSGTQWASSPLYLFVSEKTKCLQGSYTLSLPLSQSESPLAVTKSKTKITLFELNVSLCRETV